jgi:signal transduction histidine kinase
MTAPRRAALLLWPIAGVAGLGLDVAVLGVHRPGRVLPDIAVGWVFLAAALVLERRDRRVAARLLGLTGVAWFAGTAVPELVHLHRATLVHAAFAVPHGRLSRGAALVVAAAYAVSLVPAAWGRGPLSAVLATGLLLAVLAHVRSARGALRRARRQAGVSLAVALGTLVAASGVRAAFPQGDADAPMLLVYQVALITAALLLTRTVPAAPDPVADLVVRLGDDRSGAVRDELARALGDPSLQVGYRVHGGFVDAGGLPVSTTASPDRAVTAVPDQDDPVAVLVHDRSLVDDPALRDAVAVAARLTTDNAALRRRVEARAGELEGSRRRLLAAADREQARLGLELEHGAQRRLREVERHLEQARRRETSSAVAGIEGALTELRGTQEDLAELARGLYPRRLTDGGLVVALDALASSSPVPVEVRADPMDGLSVEVAAATWFVAAEALANVVKHAGASRVDLSVHVARDTLRLTVEDDGAGGATLSPGRGLAGLAERLSTLGGRLSFDSPPGGGTRLSAELPVPARSADAPPGGAGPEHPREGVSGLHVAQPDAARDVLPSGAEQQLS